MKVENASKQSRTISLNDIPAGQVFYGAIEGASIGGAEKAKDGLWWKVSHAFGLGNVGYELLVIRLDKDGSDDSNWIRTTCVKVYRYRPVDAKVVVTE